jgi:hypothetical protein
MRRIYCVLLPILVIEGLAFAQGAGIQPGEIQQGDVSLDTLNVHLDIPVLPTKAGNGLPFSFGVHFNNNFYTISSSKWSPTYPGGAIQHGWSRIPIGGSYTGGLQTGAPGCPTYAYYTVTGYTEQNGTTHPLNVSFCSDSSRTYTLVDGSGMTLVADINSQHIVLRDGTIVTPYAITDVNGNSITQNSSTNVFTDTLNVTQLTISGSGTAASPTVYTYPIAGGYTANTTIYYKTYTVHTNFVCSGITEFGPASVDLVDHIVLGNGSQYTFMYEPTPGFSGQVTGRLQSVTTPTGGTAAYTYTGPNNGINCADGSAAGLTKTTSDGRWTYTRNSSTWLSTAALDPAGNETDYTFAKRGAQFFETEQKSYQGLNQGTSPTLLVDVVTCYNGNQTSCPTAAAPTLPVTQVDKYSTWGGMSLASRTSSQFDAYQNMIYQAAYDFGVTTPTVYTQFSYGTMSNGTCVTIGNSINDRTCSASAFDSANNPLARAVYTYDSHGNQLSKSVWASGPVSGGLYLTSSATYNANGTIATATDVNGAQTSFLYNGTGGCNNGFVTSVSYPLNLSASAQWDCNGGVNTTAQDANGKSVSTSFGSDPFWRPASITDELGNITQFSFPSATAFEAFLNFNNGHSIADGSTTLDAMGRTALTQRHQAPGSPNWDTTQYVYSFDATGFKTSVSMPCVAGVGGGCGTPLTTQTRDALGRPLVTTDGGGGTVTNTYSGRDVRTTIGPVTTGELVKQVQKEYDGLGRLKSVCQLSSAFGSGSCGQDLGGTGFVTTYSYDPLGHVLQVVKNAQSSTTTQTRLFTYDRRGRVLTETYPESGKTTYTYDTWPAGNVCWYTANNAGDMLTKTDNAGNMTCYLHDQLHRLTDAAGWVNGTGWRGPCRRFRYDSTTNGIYTAPSGFPTSPNAKGHLIEVETDGTSSNQCPWPPTAVTDEWFAYSARGETTDVWEYTPHSGGYYHTTVAYSPNGVLNSLSGIPGQSTWTYGVDGEGRPNTAIQGSTNLVANTTFNAASQPLVVTVGLGDSANYDYDSSTGRMNNYRFIVGAQGASGSGSVSVSSNTGGLQSVVVQTSPATSGTGSVTISGSDRCRYCATRGEQWDTGVVSITVNSHSTSTTYGKSSTSTGLASTLASQINGDASFSVTATSSGGSVYLTAKTTGAATNYSLSAASYTTYTTYFTGTSFPVTTSG